MRDISQLLFTDLKSDEEKSAFFLSGRAYETGVVASTIQNELAMAYHRIVELKKELAEAQRELIAKEAERAGLELERNNAQRQHTMQCAINKTDSQRILELTSRLAEAQKNEKRYLWMRDKETSEGWDIIGRSGTPDQIDAAIDNAAHTERFHADT